MPEPSPSATAVQAVDVVQLSAAVPSAGQLVKRRGRVTFWLAATWVLLVIFLAVFADFLPFVQSYSHGSVLNGRISPSTGHWFGTDSNGRDIFARTVYAGRVSMSIGLASVVLGLTLGGLLGMFAGYYRKRIDSVITTAMDVMLAFPPLVLALTLITFGQDKDLGDRTISPFGLFDYKVSRLLLVIGALAVLSVPPLTRIVRANTMVYAEREFVLASRALGARDRRVLFREILPNVVPPMLSFALTALGVLIVAEGALAFLGLSVRPPQPTWGFLIFEGLNPLRERGDWWISLLPAAYMFLTILSINLLGDVASKRFDIREAIA